MINFFEIIKIGETETVEFKKSTSLMREATETICAFANSNGGYLFFGIDDDGKVTGQQVSDDTLRNIANSIALNTDPKLYPSVRIIDIDCKTCILVEIEESPLKPHLAYGRPYLRVGSTNQRVDRNYYEILLMQRYNGYGFDYQIQSTASIEDIDADSVYEFVEIINSNRNLNISLVLSAEEILHKLELISDKGITNAALLLFGKNPERYFSHHYELKMGVFDADEQYNLIKNEQEFKGNLFYIFKQAFLMLLNSITKEVKKQEMSSVETYEIPVKALREALVNMIVHRDYRVDIKSTVEVRPSFISFYNPGHLFSPAITIDGLKRTHPSRPGNKLIAKAFYMAGLFENWGGGTLKIVDECKNAGLKDPVFSFSNGMFRLEIQRKF